MENKLGSAFHRYSALIFLFCMLYLVFLVINSIVSQQDEVKQQYENSQFQLHKYQLIVDSLPTLKTDHQTLQSQLNNDRRYLIATNRSLAVAKFQQQLRRVIKQSGAKLSSMQVDKVNNAAETDILPVNMRMHLRLDDGALLKLLHQLESREPTGFIHHLKIKRQALRTSHLPGQGQSQSQLDCHLEYTVFMGIFDDN